MTEQEVIKRIAKAIRQAELRSKLGAAILPRASAKAAWNEMKAIAIQDKAQRIHRRASDGGLARAASLTPERRSEIARNAAQARWL